MKIKQTHKKALSILLSVLLLFSGIIPISVYAENNPDATGSGCTHHQEHTPECGYTDEGGICTFQCTICPIQERIDDLPSVEELEEMDETKQDEIIKEYKAILEAIAELSDKDQEFLNRNNLDALKDFIDENGGTETPPEEPEKPQIPPNVTQLIKKESAGLNNQAANITKQSDTEYTISFPGVTRDTPLKYEEDFLQEVLTDSAFSAEVTNYTEDPNLKPPKSMPLSTASNASALDYHKVTEAKDESGNIPMGDYTMTLDFSKIVSSVPIVKQWKNIAFDDGSQRVTIHVKVGSTPGDDSIFDPYKIKTVSPDNVTFNLFDYWVDGETAHTHLNKGTHKYTLATCGIPSCTGETAKVLSGDTPTYATTGYYDHGINKGHALVFSPAGNESGGWNFNTNNNKGDSFDEFQGGPYYELVQNKLSNDGYPVLNLTQEQVNETEAFKNDNRPANESLAYLFAPKDDLENGKRVYTDAKGLLKRDTTTGMYKYSSLENFASFDRNSKYFDVYNSWAVKGGESAKGQFFPFNTASQVFSTNEDGSPKTDPNGILTPNETNSTNDAFLNPYLGLTMEVTFQQPVGGKLSNMGNAQTPMTFRFSGDDDVWIFIDDVLVADIGGIHDTETATIDFSTGKIKIDRTDRFENETTSYPNSRKETTIKEQFTKADALIESEMNGDTFADNTVHTLTMFYMERGNQASNLELEFNLQDPQYSSLEKVDQDGIGLEDITFDLYEANVSGDKWESIGEPLATLTTEENGAIDFAVTDNNGVKKVIIFDETKNYILRERQKPRGFVTQGDIHLKYHAASGTLKVDNKWETGAVGGFKAQLSMTSSLYSYDGKTDLTDQAQGGLIIAVPMYNPSDTVGAEATEGWIPLYGSAFDGFQAVEMQENPGAPEYSKATMEAAFRQFANPEYEHWHLYWNEELQRYEGTLNDLPGAVEDYIFIDKENGNILTAYYLFNPSDDLFEGCTTDDQKCERLAELTAKINLEDQGSIEELVEKYNKDFTLLNLDNFNRQFYSRLYIPNKVRDLWVQKKDEAGNPLAGAEFTLYSDESCTTPMAKGITNEDGYISFSAQNTGNNAVTNPDGGLSSEVQYALMRNLNKETGEITDGKLWLQETKPPEGYKINPTVTKVLISSDYLYADAGNATDDVSVARGLGSLVETMVRYASDGAIDITLRDIIATKYNYTGTLEADGFPDIETSRNWSKDETSKPLNLHFGLGSSLMDYGLHDKTVPAFESETGWYGIGVAQNWDAHNDSTDPYYNPHTADTNITTENISALFTGSTTIIYKDKKDPDSQKPQSLTVKKTVSGNGGDTSKPFNFTVTLSDETITGVRGDMTFTNGVATFTLKHGESKTAKDLPEGINYTVVEEEAGQDGYSTTSTGASGTITEDGAIASFVNTKNTYIPPSTGSLTVTKSVAGSHGDTNKDFHFTVTLGNKYINGTFGDMTFTNGVATFTLKHGERKVAYNLPLTTYEVVEQEANQDGYSTTSTGASGTITVNGAAAAFVNTKNDEEPDPKTGDLTVSKTVSGKLGDTDRDFRFTVTLGDTSIDGKYGDMTFQDGVATFTLKHGESMTAKGLPAGIRYTVTESDNAGYKVTSTDETGSIIDGDTVVALFNNHKGTGTDDKIDVTVKKIWKLDSGGKRTDSVTAVLLRDGKEYDRVTLSSQNDWTYTWTELSDEYTWTVTEVNVPSGFTAKVAQNGLNFTIINDDKSTTPSPTPTPYRPSTPSTPSNPYTPSRSYEPGTPDSPSRPDTDPDTPEDPGDSTTTPDTSTTSDKAADEIPKTGDETNLTLWLVLLGISAAGIAAALLGRNLKYRRKISKK